MVAIPQTFNVDDLNTSGGGLVHIPEGWYNAVCVNSEIKNNNKNTGQYIALTFAITSQEHNGVQLIEMLNIINPNQTAVEIAYNTLGKIAKALGMTTTPSDTTMIHNKPIQIEVKTKQAENWTDRDGVVREGKLSSEIKGYRAAQQVGAPQQKVAQSAPQQAQQLSPQVATAPAKSPFAL